VFRAPAVAPRPRQPTGATVARKHGARMQNRSPGGGTFLCGITGRSGHAWQVYIMTSHASLLALAGEKSTWLPSTVVVRQRSSGGACNERVSCQSTCVWAYIYHTCRTRKLYTMRLISHKTSLSLASPCVCVPMFATCTRRCTVHPRTAGGSVWAWPLGSYYERIVTMRSKLSLSAKRSTRL